MNDLYPDVIVGGYPNSGTSFLCNLIVALGKSPGKEKSLKKADEHNRYGYYENLKIRKITHDYLGLKYFAPWQADFNQELFVSKKQNKTDYYAKKISKIAKRQGVEVYKDNALPYVYELFSPNAKFINIKRNFEDAYNSPVKGGHTPIPCSVEQFSDSYQNYLALINEMGKSVDLLSLDYESFFSNTSSELERIIQFLDLNTDENTRSKCLSLFKPR